MNSCKNCTHNHQRECRRYPPTAIILPLPEHNPLAGRVGVSLKTLCTFPTVQDDMFCGEYQAKLALMS